MLIEASGASEPSQIAPLFKLCVDEHDHQEEHEEGPQLWVVARLDTCVTVVDAAEFYNNLGGIKVSLYIWRIRPGMKTIDIDWYMSE